jgi:hypothetical protein
MLVTLWFEHLVIRLRDVQLELGRDKKLELEGFRSMTIEPETDSMS